MDTGVLRPGEGPAGLGAHRVPVAQGPAQGQQPGRASWVWATSWSTPTSRRRTCCASCSPGGRPTSGRDVIADIEKSGKDFYDVLKLASIVQRETSLDSEKPKVAGVYTNRLNGLAGPTVPECRTDGHLRQRRHQAPEAAVHQVAQVPLLGPDRPVGPEQGQGRARPRGIPELAHGGVAADPHRLAHAVVHQRGRGPRHQGRLPLLLCLPRQPAAPVRQDPRGPAQQHQLLPQEVG